MTDHKPRILFVDDNTNILKALARLLYEQRNEWDLDFVDSGEVAVREAHDRRFDVVVTDLAMPGMSGLDVIRALNEDSPETKCIILTGTADLQTAAEIINTVRVFRFYAKPCATEVLVDGIMAGLVDAASSSDSASISGDGPESVVLDRLSTGVLVVTRKGGVIYMNQSAAEIIAAADGLSIGHDQVLRASTSEETGNLRDACLRLDGAPGNGDVVALSIERPSMRESLKLILAPLENPDGNAEGRLIVFVTDPGKKAFPSAEMIARFFSLTPTESQFAWKFICGQRTDEIAQAMGITISSARTYLKRVMEKTGTNRQVDLVKLLLSTPRIIARPKSAAPRR